MINPYLFHRDPAGKFCNPFRRIHQAHFIFKHNIFNGIHFLLAEQDVDSQVSGLNAIQFQFYFTAKKLP